MKRKRTEQVRVTQMNGPGRDRRGSCADEEVCSNPAISKRKTLAMAGVVQRYRVNQALALFGGVTATTKLYSCRILRCRASGLNGNFLRSIIPKSLLTMFWAKRCLRRVSRIAKHSETLTPEKCILWKRREACSFSVVAAAELSVFPSTAKAIGQLN